MTNKQVQEIDILNLSMKKTNQYTRENGPLLMDKRSETEGEFRYGRTDLGMTVFGKTEWLMGEDDWFMQMVMFTSVIGCMTRLTDSEYR